MALSISTFPATRQQKTDKRDAAHILKLLVEGRFPRIWMPSSEVRDLRQLLLNRYKLVIIRARVKNELQHLCLNKGVQRKRKLWSAAGQQILRELPLKPWAGRRRDDLLKLMAMLDQQIEPLDQAVQEEAQRDKMALLLQTQPGVGPITALRSEEHTSELQSPDHLVCRLLLEKKKTNKKTYTQ